MSSLFSYRRAENQITREFCRKIELLHLPKIKLGENSISIITVIWSLLRDDNFSTLLKISSTEDLHTILSHGDITLLNNTESKEHLNISNFITIKSAINQFYNDWITISQEFEKNKQFINKDAIIKSLKQQEVSLPLLLRQEQFLFKLQKIITLPIITIQDKTEDFRPQISFITKRQLDDFLLFLNTSLPISFDKPNKISRLSLDVKEKHRSILATMVLLSFIAIGIPFGATTLLKTSSINHKISINEDNSTLEIKDIILNKESHNLFLVVHNPSKTEHIRIFSLEFDQETSISIGEDIAPQATKNIKTSFSHTIPNTISVIIEHENGKKEMITIPITNFIQKEPLT